jgi:hypothetical protein
MFGIGRKVLSFTLLVGMAMAPLACTTVNNPSDNPPKTVNVIKPADNPKVEVNVNKPPEETHKTEVIVH